MGVSNLFLAGKTVNGHETISFIEAMQSNVTYT